MNGINLANSQLSQIVYIFKNIKDELIKVTYVIQDSLNMTNNLGRNMSEN